MEGLISTTLRAGVLTGAVLIALGLLLLAVTGSTGYGPVGTLQTILAFESNGSPGHFPITPAAVLAGVVQGKPYAIVESGVLVLMATPVLRVALSVGVFSAQRDRLYVAITLAVLGILVLSYLLGGVE